MKHMTVDYYDSGDQSGTARPLFKYVLRSATSPQSGKIRVEILTLGPTNQPGAVAAGFNEIVTEDEETAFLGTLARLNSHHHGLRANLSPIKDGDG